MQNDPARNFHRHSRASLRRERLRIVDDRESQQMKLRSYLILLIVAAVLPVVIFAAVMTYLSYRQQRENLADRMIERTRAISAALDREFLVSIQSLKVLAASTHLDKGELAEFYGDMKGALASYSRAWQNLTLVDAADQQLINLRRPFGSPLPTQAIPKPSSRHAVRNRLSLPTFRRGPSPAFPASSCTYPFSKTVKQNIFSMLFFIRRR